MEMYPLLLRMLIKVHSHAYYDCQFGDKYYKQKPVKGKRLLLQGSRKVGCRALIEVKTFVLYPEYAVSDAEKEGLSKWKLRCLYEEKIKQLKTALTSDKSVKIKVKYFVFVPSEEAHSGHPTGHTVRYSQKLYKPTCVSKNFRNSLKWYHRHS